MKSLLNLSFALLIAFSGVVSAKTFEGKVVVNTGGKPEPLANAKLVLLDADGNPVLDEKGRKIITFTDKEGSFQFTGLDEGVTYRFEVFVNGISILTSSPFSLSATVELAGALIVLPDVVNTEILSPSGGSFLITGGLVNDPDFKILGSPNPANTGSAGAVTP